MRRALLVALLVASAVGVSHAEAAPGGPAQFVEIWRDIQYPVEQQTDDWMLYDPVTDTWYVNPDHTNWVENPTNDECIWDVDDQIHWWIVPPNTRVDANVSVSETVCQIIDYRSHLWWVNVVASTPNLTVTLDMQQIGETFTIHPVKTGGSEWSYAGCVSGPASTISDAGHLPEIADSNGGRGVFDQGTLTIANRTNKVARDVQADLWVGRQAPWEQVCPLPRTEVIFTDQYGEWRYYVGLS